MSQKRLIDQRLKDTFQTRVIERQVLDTSQTLVVGQQGQDTSQTHVIGQQILDTSQACARHQQILSTSQSLGCTPCFKDSTDARELEQCLDTSRTCQRKQQLQDTAQTRVCEFQPPARARSHQKDAIVDGLYHKSCRLLVIYGEIFAGKAHFAKQVIDRVRCRCHTQRRTGLNHVLVRCLGVTSWNELLVSLAQALGVYCENTEFGVKNRLRELAPGAGNLSYILLFTNFEDIVSQHQLLRKFTLFIQDLLELQAGVSVILTSRVNAVLSYRPDVQTCKLEPLGELECLELLKPILHMCKTLEPMFQIVRRCFYRPALILRVTHILKTYSKGLTPEEVAEALRRPNGVLNVFTRYPTPEGALADAIRRHLDLLPPQLESDTRKLCYLNGSFGVTEATKKLGKPSPSDLKMTTLVPLQEFAIVKIDSQQEQIQIDPFIRAFLLESIGHVHHNDPYKKLFADFLGHVLGLMRFEISVKTKGRALGFAHDNFWWLEKTLTQAVNTFGEESYSMYFQVIELEEGSMSALCPEKAVSFYKGMAEASSRFGSPREQALLQGFYAVSLIEKKGDELLSAVNMVTDSLNKLTAADDYHRVVLMRRLGWIHIRLGDNKKAKEVLTEALNLCGRVPRSRRDMVEPHNIQIHSHLAIVNSFLGNFPEAERILRSTIPRAKRVMPDHPVLAVLLQTMGLNKERQGHNDKALTYYQVSGCERRKLEKTLPSYLVTNLNNRALRYIWRGELDKAFPLMENALNIRRKLGWWDYNTALTLWYRANAYLFRFQADESIRSCEQAKEVLIRCTPRHTSNVDVRVTLAHAYMELGNRQKAEETLQETLDYASEFQENMNGIGLLTALEHLVLMREEEADFGDLHRRLIHEAERLSDVFRDTDNSKYFLLQRKLSSWREYLGHVFCRDRGQEHTALDLREGHREVGFWKGRRGGDCDDEDIGKKEEQEKNEVIKVWNIWFSCEHCEMLHSKHKPCRQTMY